MMRVSLVLRKEHVKNPSREIAMLIAKNHSAYSLSEISIAMHMNSYSSVSSAIFRSARKMTRNSEFNGLYNRCLQMLKNGGRLK